MFIQRVGLRKRVDTPEKIGVAVTASILPSIDPLGLITADSPESPGSPANHPRLPVHRPSRRRLQLDRSLGCSDSEEVPIIPEVPSTGEDLTGATGTAVSLHHTQL